MGSKFSTKQALWFTIINYLGVGIGTLSTLFIYPYDKELLGVIRFIDGFAQILYPIMVLGASTALLNFQPQLSQFLQRKLFSYSIVSIVGMILFCAIGVWVLHRFTTSENKQYFVFAFGIAICLAFVDLFKRQSTNLQKLAIPTFYEKIIPKLSLPLVFVLIYYANVSTHFGLQLYVASFGFMMIAIALYLKQHFQPVYSLRFSDLFAEMPKKTYYQYSFYAFAASLGSFFAFRIDSVMIPEFISSAANGDFNIGVNLANALMIPATGVFALYSPIISEAIKKKNHTLLKTKYIEVAKNLFFIGIAMYGCVLLGLPTLFSVLPTADQLTPTLPILFILGANVVVNMSTGFSTEIIAFSSFYRFNLVAILVLALLSVALNYYILTQTQWGIVGVAYASFLSMSVFNLMKLIFIYKKLKILPFDLTYFVLILYSISLLLVFCQIPIFASPIVYMISICAGYLTLLVIPALYFKWISKNFISIKRK